MTLNSIKIPDQLRRQRFIKTYEKRPVENSWTLDTSLYIYDENKHQWSNIIDGKIYIDSKTSQPYPSPNVNNYSITELKTISSTYGVLCGFNGLFVVDCDNKDIEEYLMKQDDFKSTFIVKTASSQLNHFYFYDTDTRHPITVRIDDEHDKRICDIQGVGTQVIGPGSYLEINNEKRYYSIANDVQIKQVSYQKILDIVLKFSDKTVVHQLKQRKSEVNVYDEKDEIIKKIKEKITVPQLLTRFNIDISHNPCDSPFTMESKNRKCLHYTDQTFNDFHTGLSGSLFHLYMYYYNVDFITAKYQLQLITGVKTEEQNFLMDKYMFFYLNNDKNNRRFGIIDKSNNKVSYHTKAELVEYLIYNNENIYELLNVDVITNVDKRRKLVTNIVNNFLDKNIVALDGIGYCPVNEITFSYNNHTYLNTYRPSSFIQNVPLQQTDTKDFSNMYHIISHLCKNDKKLIDYFMNWLAHILKYPTIKLSTSFIFMGAHGTGKGVLKQYILSYLFGSDNVTEITQNTIIRGWGDYMRSAQIIVADEINLNAKQHIEVCDRLKNNTTNPEITVDIKRQDSQKMRNYTHWIFTSNKELPFHLENGDRRYIVIEQLNKIDTAYVTNIDPVFNEITHRNEIYALYNYLLNIKVDRLMLSKPIETEEKELMIQASENNTIKFIEDIRTFENFKDFLNELKMKVTIIEDFIPMQEVYNIFKKWCENNGMIHTNKINFGRELSKRYNIISELKRVLDTPQRVYYIGELMGRDTNTEDIPKHINDGSDELRKDFEL